jgi:large conductance mechanosensitive channel
VRPGRQQRRALLATLPRRRYVVAMPARERARGIKKLVTRGVDLAGGVTGAAFEAIVSSLVGDVIIAIVGAMTGGRDLSNDHMPPASKVQQGLSMPMQTKRGAVFGYGQFLPAVNFLIIVMLFVVV